MMLKKIILGVSLASAAVVAQAQSSENCDFFSGVYVGAGAIYQSTNDKYTINSLPYIKFKHNADIYAGHDAWGGDLFAGFGKVYNRTYAGFELYGKAPVGKQKLASMGDDDYIAMKTPYSYGAMAKLGYLVSPQALVYVGLGAENTKFKLIGTTPKGDQDLVTDNKWGFVPSVGMDLALDCNWQVGARFSYADYKNLDLKVNNAPSLGTVDPRRTTFALNVTYHFV